MVSRRTKQAIINEIADVVGVARRPVANGSTEPKSLFVDIIRQLHLPLTPTLSKPDLAEAIAAAGGEPWGPEHDSRGTPSGGGSTVSAIGLEAVLRAVQRLAGAPPPPPPLRPLGTTYRPADEDVRSAPRDPVEVDPDAVDRANAAHRTTQNSVAQWASDEGFDAISPAPGDPAFDVGWRDGEDLYVVEVKSLLGASEDVQMRLALGQVLDYQRQIAIRTGRAVRAAVVTSRPPTSDRWESLFLEHGVALGWPSELDRLNN